MDIMPFKWATYNSKYIENQIEPWADFEEGTIRRIRSSPG